MPKCSQFKSYGKLVDGKIHFLGKHLYAVLTEFGTGYKKKE